MRIDPNQNNANFSSDNSKDCETTLSASNSNNSNHSNETTNYSDHSVEITSNVQHTVNQSLKTTLKSQGREIRKFFMGMEKSSKTSSDYQSDFRDLLDSMDLSIHKEISNNPELSTLPKSQVQSYITNIRESREIFHNVDEAYQRIG